jgi:hypothetical protein
MTNTREPLTAEEQQAVARLHVDYARFIDDGLFEHWGTLFGHDGVLRVYGNDIVGDAAVAEFGRKAPPGVHTQGGALVTRQEDGSLRSAAPFVYINADTCAATAGWYHDQLVSVANGYRFRLREIDIRTKR